MNINEGIQLDEPGIFVPWKISEQNLVALFNGKHLKTITDGYYASKCTLFKGLTCMVGFHFEPGAMAPLSELEFFRTNYDDQQSSFNEFQKYFVQEFGEPSNITTGSEGFNNYEWILGNIKIIHLVYDRFGPEEYLIIRNMAHSQISG